jgi:hypothetical protein
MLFIRQNLSGIVPIFEDGDIVQECNCSQPIAHTPFGKKADGKWAINMKFIDSNMHNCDLPPDINKNALVNCLTIHTTMTKIIKQRTDKDSTPINAKILMADEVEVTSTEMRTIECGDGSITEQAFVTVEIINSKGEQTKILEYN